MVLSIWHENDLASIPSASTFVFKLCYGQLVLPWIVDQFDLKAILLVRHPCAVVASQLRFGDGWGKINERPQFPVPECRFNELFARHRTALEAVRTPEENLAAMWALTMLATVHHRHNNEKWLAVSYEHLLTEPEAQLARIFNHVERDVPGAAFDQLTRPSKTSSEEAIPANQVSKWKDVLSREQVSRILAMTERFGIELYSENELPVESVLCSGIEEGEPSDSETHDAKHGLR